VQTLESATLSGASWTPQSASTIAAQEIAVPLATDDGHALLAFQPQGDAPISIATFDPAGGWRATLDSTGVINERDHLLVGPPALALGPSGSALVAFARIDTIPDATFLFTTRAAGVWSAEMPLPGAGTTSAASQPRIALSAPGDGDPIVAVWSAHAGLLSATYSGGAWSSPTALAPDATGGSFRPFVLTRLADDRVMLAYLTQGSTAGAIGIASFDGTSWSAAQRVPGANVAASSYPFGVARGIEGAVLEVAYLEATTNHILHVRLMDASSWSWTSPAVVDATVYDCVALASGP
jgi:hypothetical protein